MWQDLKTIVLTAFTWTVATIILSAMATVAWSLGPSTVGLPALGFVQILGVVGTLVIVVAAIRFAFSAPLLTHGPNGYGNLEFQVIQWPPPPPGTQVHQDVRIPPEMRVNVSGKLSSG